jgi:hypothetical protein
MEAVLLPRVSYGAPVWATQHKKSKLKTMADKFYNLAAIYTLGTFKSTPIKWHRTRSAVREAAPTFLGTSLKFFSRKLTIKRQDRNIERILLTQGFLKPVSLGLYGGSRTQTKKGERGCISREREIQRR